MRSGLFLLITSFLLTTSAFSLKVSETLYFRAHWNNLTGGFAKLKILKQTKIEGRNVYVLSLQAKTTKLMDRLFKVRDHIKSYWSIKDRSPVKVIKDLKEGYNHRLYEMKFCFKKKEASFTQRAYYGNSSIIGVKKIGAEWRNQQGFIRPISLDSQDMLSALYFLRTSKEKVRIGKNFYLNIVDDRKRLRINFKITKRETIKTALGTFKALRIVTDFKTKGILKSRGKIIAWVSDDANRLPLRVTAAIPVLGRVNVELVKTIGLQNN